MHQKVGMHRASALVAGGAASSSSLLQLPACAVLNRIGGLIYFLSGDNGPSTKVIVLLDSQLSSMAKNNLDLLCALVFAPAEFCFSLCSVRAKELQMLCNTLI